MALPLTRAEDVHKLSEHGCGSLAWRMGEKGAKGKASCSLPAAKASSSRTRLSTHAHRCYAGAGSTPRNRSFVERSVQARCGCGGGSTRAPPTAPPISRASRACINSAAPCVYTSKGRTSRHASVIKSTCTVGVAWRRSPCCCCVRSGRGDGATACVVREQGISATGGMPPTLIEREVVRAGQAIGG